MNANTYLLLSTVLTDRPCYDASLQSAIRTAPFAVSSIANQCFYTIFTASVARGLLLDDRSVYSRVIEGIAEQQALMEEVKIGKIMVVYSGEGCSSCQTPPSQRRASTSTSGYDHRPLTGSPNPQVVEVHFPEQHPPTPSSPVLTDGDSGAAGGAGAGAEQQDEQSPGSDASTWRFTPRKVVVAPRSLADLPPVLPVSSLDLRLVVVGGGTVCRRLLHVLLDERPGLLHPTRITVATRQPENLNVFATKGVLCVKPKHAREALNHCDILVLACQPGHLQAFVKTQFAPRQFETDDIYDQPARLRRNTIVFSCLAAYPIKKLGKLLHHNPALILRSDVAIEPNELPTVAAKLEETTSACTKLQVQLMADHDSFLQVAVKEAEDGEVQRHAAQLVEDQLARGELSKVPYAIAYRAAMASARTSALTRHIPPTVPDVLLAESRPSISFLCAVWMVMQSFAQATGEAEEAARQGAKQQQAASSNTEGLTAAESAAAKRRAKAKADKRRPPTTEGPFLCAALATLPASRNEVVAAATMQKHGVPTTLFPTPVTARGMETPRSYAMSTHTTGSRVPAGSEGDAVAAPEVINTALRKLPNVYTDELTLCCDLQKRYEEVFSRKVPHTNSRPPTSSEQ